MPYWHYTMEYGLRSMAACGFKNIEFWAASPQYCYSDYTPEERKARKREIIETMCDAGLKMPIFSPEQMDMYPLNIASPDMAIQRASMERILEYLDDAAEFGACAMTLGTGWQYLDMQDERSRARSIEFVQKIAEKAAPLKIDLLIAPMRQTSGAFVWNLESLGQYLQAVSMPNVKACIHLLDAIGNTPWFDQFKGSLGLVHFSDLGGKTLGIGGADICGALHWLENSGYDGLTSLEITFRDCCVDPDRAVFSSAKWLKRNGFLSE